MNAINERSDSTSIAANASSVQPSECFVKFSCVLATSLAAAKRLSWEQTPWLNEKLEISACKEIAYYLSLQEDREVSWQALRNAVLLGETYLSSEVKMELGTYPQLLVVFPHLKRDVSKDAKFVEFWHDRADEPAFNLALEDSGKGKIQGVTKDLFGRVHAAALGGRRQTQAGRQVLPAAGFLHHLRNDRKHRVCDKWPEISDPDKQACILDEAWLSIKGWMHDLPGMEEFQDPFLLIVNRSRHDFNPELPLQKVFKNVGEHWDRFIDARHVQPGSFKVMMQTMLGDCNQIAQELDRVERDNKDKAVGRVEEQGKRKGEDGQEKGQHDTVKRRKTHH